MVFRSSTIRLLFFVFLARSVSGIYVPDPACCVFKPSNFLKELFFFIRTPIGAKADAKITSLRTLFQIFYKLFCNIQENIFKITKNHTLANTKKNPYSHHFTPFTSSKPFPNTPITVFIVINTLGSIRFATRNTSMASFLRTTTISIFFV